MLNYLKNSAVAVDYVAFDILVGGFNWRGGALVKVALLVDVIGGLFRGNSYVGGFEIFDNCRLFRKEGF